MGEKKPHLTVLIDEATGVLVSTQFLPAVLLRLWESRNFQNATMVLARPLVLGCPTHFID
ncbi:MAG: hypothetical protein ACU4EQ_10945 [Candidatus Nitrosoglobus sp.]